MGKLAGGNLLHDVLLAVSALTSTRIAFLSFWRADYQAHGARRVSGEAEAKQKFFFFFFRRGAIVRPHPSFLTYVHAQTLSLPCGLAL